MTAIALTELTDGTVKGSGIFDKLMAASKAHLDEEFKRGSLKGAEYATVYLGMLQAVMSQSLAFLSQRDKLKLEAELLQKQIDLAEAQILNTEAQTNLVNKQIEVAEVEKERTQAQVAQITAETLNIPKQGLLIDAQKNVALAQELKTKAETLNVPKQGILIDNQAANEVKQGLVLVAQECLLQAQFDNTMATVLKTKQEEELLKQKVVTEKAQVLGIGVDEDSIIGKQKILYTKQAAGFDRNAELNVMKEMIGTWNTRRMTDEGTVADSVNKLDDSNIGRAVSKVFTGINA